MRKNLVGSCYALAVVIALGGCAEVRPAKVPSFVDHAIGTSFTITDKRPEKESQWEALSHLVTSCDYGVHRLGDATIPAPLTILKSDLAQALGTHLAGKSLTVLHYEIYSNNSYELRNGVYSHHYGLMYDFMSGMGSSCKQEETTGGWYQASEVTTPYSPIVIEISGELDGRKFEVRSVYSPEHPIPTKFFDKPENAAELLNSLHKANDLFAKEISAAVSS